MSNKLSPELQAQIVEEAKNFAFYNYVSAAHNGSAVFDDIESWPDSAQVAYYAIVNYANGTGVCWPFPQTTLPVKWQEAEQRADRYEKALREIRDMDHTNPDAYAMKLKAYWALTHKTSSDGSANR